ncbi:hypothetical protein, partial [Streptococcus merionis]|uniref:hypothetical protein n=1 Tax=Streptococcus merionis TaxID=400065 RepID=UPI0026F0C7E2
NNSSKLFIHRALPISIDIRSEMDNFIWVSVNDNVKDGTSQSFSKTIFSISRTATSASTPKCIFFLVC